MGRVKTAGGTNRCNRDKVEGSAGGEDSVFCLHGVSVWVSLESGENLHTGSLFGR